MFRRLNYWMSLQCNDLLNISTTIATTTTDNIQNSNISRGIDAIKEQIPESEIRNEILDFIDTSDKGVIRGMI